MATMKFAIIGSTLITIHSAEEPTEQEYGAWLDLARKNASNITGVLVYTLGGKPNASQRQKTITLWQTQVKKSIPIAVVSDSILARGAVTALSWMLKEQIKSFASTEMLSALNHARVEMNHSSSIQKIIEQFCKELNIKIPLFL